MRLPIFAASEEDANRERAMKVMTVVDRQAGAAADQPRFPIGRTVRPNCPFSTIPMAP